MSDVMVEKDIVIKPIDEIKPYEKNPRQNKKTIELLTKIIPKVGFNVPLVIDSKGVIVKGHARYEAAKNLGLTELPCIISHASEDAIRADRIADNKIFEFSEWVNEELMHEVDMLDFDFDLSDMGLPRMDYDDIPSIEDLDFADEYDDEVSISDEDRQKLYEQFLEEQAKKNAVEVRIATANEIEQAMIKQANTPRQARDYGKCVCEKCGNVMYFDKNVLYNKYGVIRRR